jgi:hypothetical protein
MENSYEVLPIQRIGEMIEMDSARSGFSPIDLFLFVVYSTLLSVAQIRIHGFEC